MGLFHKKQKREEKVQALPSLPELPKLPEFSERKSYEFPTIDEIPRTREISQLPSYPSNNLTEKFSQNTIKHAITGQNKGDEEDKYVEEFDEYEESLPMKHKPLKAEIPREYTPKEIKEKETKKIPAPKEMKTKEAEPFFIRIDKFEDSLKIFEQTQEQIKELESLLRETKDLRLKEDQELSSWEAELQQLKSKMEKIDRELFSKIA